MITIRLPAALMFLLTLQSPGAAATSSPELVMTAGAFDTAIVAGEPALIWLAIENRGEAVARVALPEFFQTVMVRASTPGSDAVPCTPLAICGGWTDMLGLEIGPGEVFTLVEPMAMHCILTTPGPHVIGLSWSSLVDEVLMADGQRPTNWEGHLDAEVRLEVQPAETSADQSALAILRDRDGRLDGVRLGFVARDAPASRAAAWARYSDAWYGLDLETRSLSEVLATMPPEPYAALLRLQVARKLLEADRPAEARKQLELMGSLPEPLVRQLRRDATKDPHR